MARGRMVGTPSVWGSRRIRSSSVPAEHYGRSSVSDVEAARKAALIANLAAEDSDAIASASRRHDQDFLHDISAKLANMNTIHAPASPPLNHPASQVPPPSLTSRVVRSGATRPPIPVGSRLRTPVVSGRSYGGRGRSILTADDDLDIAAFLARTPSSPLPHRRSTGAAYRSSSVPPASGTYHPTLLPPAHRPTVPRWFPSSPAYYGRRGGNYSPLAGVVPVGLPPVVRTDRLDAMTDGVVGVAHTSLYGDIVIGIPYKKRYMFNVQHDDDDLDMQSLPPMHLDVPSRVSTTSTRFAPIPSHHSVLAPPPVNLSKPFARASYAGPPTTFSYRPLAARQYHHHLPARPHDDLLFQDYDDAVSTKSHPVTSASLSRLPPKYRPNRDDLENEIAESIFGDAPTNYRLSTLSKDYNNVLSRYNLPTPTSNGPRNYAVSLPDNELDRKYGQILASMQPKLSTSQHRSAPLHTDFVHAASLPPPGPPPASKPFKPVMSDTRRKLRDLLCRSRNDPHYFED